MVYCLWAGFRPLDAIRQEETLAHRGPFGSRPLHSGPDGALVTNVMLELCRLHPLGYVFGSHPQGGPPALTLELGINLGTCKALGTMYEQLRRAFKVAGSQGARWRAANGILQHCPLSVILVNASPQLGSGPFEGGPRGNLVCHLHLHGLRACA